MINFKLPFENSVLNNQNFQECNMIFGWKDSMIIDFLLQLLDYLGFHLFLYPKVINSPFYTPIVQCYRFILQKPLFFLEKQYYWSRNPYHLFLYPLILSSVIFIILFTIYYLFLISILWNEHCLLSLCLWLLYWC